MCLNSPCAKHEFASISDTASTTAHRLFTSACTITVTHQDVFVSFFHHFALCLAALEDYDVPVQRSGQKDESSAGNQSHQRPPTCWCDLNSLNNVLQSSTSSACEFK